MQQRTTTSNDGWLQISLITNHFDPTQLGREQAMGVFVAVSLTRWRNSTINLPFIPNYPGNVFTDRKCTTEYTRMFGPVIFRRSQNSIRVSLPTTIRMPVWMRLYRDERCIKCATIKWSWIRTARPKEKTSIILSRIYSSAIDGLLGILRCNHIGCCNPGNSIYSPLFETTIQLTYRPSLNRLSLMTFRGRLWPRFGPTSPLQ